MLNINDKVIILVGTYKNQIGIYKGIKNNSNWHIVFLNDIDYLVNLDEIEKIT